ncbi:dihydrolipoamide acetyltransferase family protein [Emticicia sp. 21SJ11W-3]|uniref:dihydrolipoamide acetyltransferase family protein n=1 Tax=Emticicia sp. 21SJ11W-3 TaxID=2916755 RepID=UPI00209D99EE|nr:dihydrolipoamide acetyltransferase family protein [Emticicia sp. 21SJ11W-3]UTA70305.1 2-oxo acid dehydrogenase subunit E2 [Emticicia sp. 21SJ11W-3]
MALVEMIMPKMGESIFECTVLNWLKNVGDTIEQDEMILEVATDKIDTEIGSQYDGVIKEILVKQGEIATIGKPICIIETDAVQAAAAKEKSADAVVAIEEKEPEILAAELEQQSKLTNVILENAEPRVNSLSGRFYSPLVQNIAREENISIEELESLKGTGIENRVTKDDILAYVQLKKDKKSTVSVEQPVATTSNYTPQATDQIIEMDRMRKMIAERMIESKRISAHVTSFVETDMTNVALWRDKIKAKFQQETGENITFTPLLIEAVVKAIKDFPMINIQIDGDRIIRKGKINIGMAVALPSGNLIVPVIHEADSYSLIGLTKKVNELAQRARGNKLKADDLSDGTLSMSNIGSFGNIAGTPIIMQPQVSILAFGVIQKKVSVIETAHGDTIGIRQKMIISHSYDHRVVDGSLGGQFVKRVSDYLENFDLDRKLF